MLTSSNVKNTFSNYWNNQIFTILVSFYSIVFSANKQKNEKKKKQTNLLWKNSQVLHVLEPQSFAYASEEAVKRHSSLTRSIRPVLIHLPEFWSGSTRTEFHYRDCFDSLPPLQQISAVQKKKSTIQNSKISPCICCSDIFIILIGNIKSYEAN